ncbi:oxygenase MpaB family protein [Mycobacterium sp. 2YAF39]|uniref:oxygenase MpaB family protein n=1 Tax=Mycobacterium sp. 2YAF39 TaxID=3233033 RepID=UPI003F972736
MSVDSHDVSVAPIAAIGDREVQAMDDVRTLSSPVADRFERIMGSKLVAMFAPALFDEMMHPAVSASLVDTARIRDDPFNRARRTAASDQLAFFSHKADRQDEMERLVRLHRDLTGVQPDGKRYSALSPEPWNWNLISIFFMHRGVFIAVGGETLSPADNQAIWDRFRHMCEGLQMAGRARQLAERYEDLCAYYDRMVDETLTHTESLDIVVDATLRPKRPEYVPSIFQPVWTLVAPAVGHLVTVLGFGIMHPKVRAIVPVPWTRRHQLIFAIATRVLRLAYRSFPTRLLHTPLARNKWEYERLVAHYKGLGLTSFSPGAVETYGH